MNKKVRKLDGVYFLGFNVVVSDNAADGLIHYMRVESLLETVLEDEPGITVDLSQCETVLHLLQSFVQQRTLYIVEHWNNANTCFCLWSCDVQFHVPGFCNPIDQVVVYIDDFVLKIAIVPAKAKAFSYPHSSAQQHCKQVYPMVVG